MHDAAHEAFRVIRDLEFVKRGDAAIVGDLYLPADKPNAPVIVAVHGGAWQRGGPKSYARLGPYLAKHGVGVFAVTYRFAPKNLFPKAVHDVRAAIQFLRAKGAGLGVDVNRIGVMGDSAGGHLASLVALAGDRPEFANQPEDAYPGVSAAVKVGVPVYGIYDLMAQWDIDRCAQCALFFGRRHQSGPFADRQAQRCPQFGMQQRGGVFKFTALADHRGFAVTLRLLWRHAQGLHATLSQQTTELFTDVNQFIQVVAEPTRIRVGNHGHRQCTACWRADGFAAVLVNFIDLHNDFADLRFHVFSCAFNANRSID